jgi:predicted secreted protein
VNTAGAIVTFIVAWWLIFLMALPIGAAPDEHPQPGTVESAPSRPRLLLKAGVTTVLAALATWAVAWFLDSGWVDLRPHPARQGTSLGEAYPAVGDLGLLQPSDTRS